MEKSIDVKNKIIRKRITITVILLVLLGVISLFLAPIVNGNKIDYLINNLIGSYKILLPQAMRPNLGLSLYVNLMLYIVLFVGLIISVKSNWKKNTLLFVSMLLMFVDNILNFINKLIYSIWYYNFDLYPFNRRILPYLQYLILIFVTFNILIFLKKNKPSIGKENSKLIRLGYIFDVLIIWFLLYVKIAISIEINFEIHFELNKILSLIIVTILYFSIQKLLFKTTIGEMIIKSVMGNVKKSK